MSKMLLKRRVFSEKEFKTADRLGRIYIHMLNPDTFSLNYYDSEYYEMMKSCFMLYREYNSEYHIFEEMLGLYPSKADQTIRKAIRDTRNFYGELEERNRAFDKMVQRERIMKHMERAEDDEDWKSVASFEKLLMQIDNTNKEITEEFDPSMLELPPINITRDVRAYFEEAQIIDEEE